MKSLLAITILTLLFALTCQISFGQESNQLPRKFDEYSKCKQGHPGCLNLEGEWARLDNFAVNLRDNPKLQGYIVGYKALQSLPGSSLRHINYVRNLVRSRIVDDSRIHIIDAGYKENLTIELWLAPDCASIPSSSNPLPVSAQDNESVYKFDEFSPRLRKEIPEEFLDDELVWNNPSVLMDGFAALLEREPKLRGYIIAYDGLKDRAGTSFTLAETYRAYIYNSASIGNRPDTITSAPSMLVTIKGGRRKERTIELWVTPFDAPAPKPGPVIPTRRRKP